MATIPVSFTSAPVGAKVYVDDRYLAQAGPATRVPLTGGTHKVRMVHNGIEVVQNVTVSTLRRNAFHWEVGTAALSTTQ